MAWCKLIPCSFELKLHPTARGNRFVQSVRVGDKVKQKIVRYVGIAMNEDELGRLRELA